MFTLLNWSWTSKYNLHILFAIQCKCLLWQYQLEFSQSNRKLSENILMNRGCSQLVATSVLGMLIAWEGRVLLFTLLIFFFFLLAEQIKLSVHGQLWSTVRKQIKTTGENSDLSFIYHILRFQEMLVQKKNSGSQLSRREAGRVHINIMQSFATRKHLNFRHSVTWRMDCITSFSLPISFLLSKLPRFL